MRRRIGWLKAWPILRGHSASSVPPLWRAMDIEDILKYERHNVDPQHNWEQLLRTFYRHRARRVTSNPN